MKFFYQVSDYKFLMKICIMRIAVMNMLQDNLCLISSALTFREIKLSKFQTESL